MGPAIRYALADADSTMNTEMDPEELQRIIRLFDSDDHVVALDAHQVGGAQTLEESFMLHSRLERAATNQITNGDATVARYAIWAETVRGIVLDALEKAAAPGTKRNLMRAANSLAAFSTIQWRLDPK
jgi:hypothetical protein